MKAAAAEYVREAGTSRSHEHFCSPGLRSPKNLLTFGTSGKHGKVEQRRDIASTLPLHRVLKQKMKLFIRLIQLFWLHDIGISSMMLRYTR